jgi:hypothetical protein
LNGKCVNFKTESHVSAFVYRLDVFDISRDHSVIVILITALVSVGLKEDLVGI